MSMIGNLLAISQTELDELYDKPETITKVLYEDYYDRVVDLDKTWQAIHFMLNGEPYGGDSLLSHLIFGIKPIGKEDVGYGAAL